MTNPREMDELHRLIGQLLDGSIPPDDHHRLQAILKNNPEAQQVYLSYIDLNLGLCHIAREAPVPSPLADLARPVRRSVSARGDSPALSLKSMSVLTLLMLTVFVAVLAYRPVPNRIDPVAVSHTTSSAASARGVALVQSAGAEFFGPAQPLPGDVLPWAQEYTLTHGMIELGFDHGVQVILNAPAVFKAVTGERIVVKIGQCSVHAPPGGEGFRVDTPSTEVVDLGTRFSVRVNEFGETDVQVVEGAAEVHPASGAGPALTLHQGDARRTDAGLIQAIPFDGGFYRSRLPDRVISYEAAPVGTSGAVRDLISITVQRDGIPRTYQTDELIGIDILHFAADNNWNNVAWDREVPGTPEETLTRDVALNTGLINPGGWGPRHAGRTPPSDALEHLPGRLGLAIQFRRPVRNDPGPDVVLFELQSPVYPPEGDHFYVGPCGREAGRHRHLVTHFDITLLSPDARQVAPFALTRFERRTASVADLSRPGRASIHAPPLPFSALAVGIDLSDLGYPPGAEVASLLIEDADDDEHNIVDPVFIGGLPAIESGHPTVDGKHSRSSE